MCVPRDYCNRCESRKHNNAFTATQHETCISRQFKINKIVAAYIPSCSNNVDVVEELGYNRIEHIFPGRSVFSLITHSYKYSWGNSRVLLWIACPARKSPHLLLFNFGRKFRIVVTLEKYYYSNSFLDYYTFIESTHSILS